MVLLAKHNDLCPTPPNGVPVPVISTERQRAEKSLFFNIAVSGFLHCTHFVPVEMTKKKAAWRRENSSRRQAALLKTLFNSYAAFTPRKLPMIADNCGIYAALLQIPPVKKPLFEQGDELAQSERHGHVFGQSQTHAAHGKRGRYVYFEQLAAFELLFAVFAGNAADSHTLYRKF